jgi:DNA-binding Lrp family transcriptional regulator
VFQRPTQEEIAKMIGTSRETVSRTMKVLEESGFFEGKGKRLRIPPESLGGSA